MVAVRGILGVNSVLGGLCAFSTLPTCLTIYVGIGSLLDEISANMTRDLNGRIGRPLLHSLASRSWRGDGFGATSSGTGLGVTWWVPINTIVHVNPIQKLAQNS